MSFKIRNFFQFKKSNESKKWSFTAKLSFLFVLIFLNGCGLKIKEDPPPVPVYYFQEEALEDFCLKLNYEEEIKKYFFNLNEGNGDELPRVLKCFSSQINSIISNIYNESLTREEMHAVLDDDLIALQNVKDFLKKILSSDYHKEFSFFKSYTFQLIDFNSDFNVEALCKVKTNEKEALSNSNDDKSKNDPPSEESLESIEKEALSNSNDNKSKNDQSSKESLESIEKEALISKTDINLILNFLSDLQKSLSFIEQQSQTLLEALLKYEGGVLEKKDKKETEADSFIEAEAKNEVHTTDLISSKKRIHFIKLLQESLSKPFSSYSDFLKMQLDLVENNMEKLYFIVGRGDYFLQEEFDYLFQSLDLFSNKNKLHLLDIKYLFMMLYSMDFLFKNYDSNKNLMIDDNEVQYLSCFIKPFLSRLIESELEDKSDWIQDYYRSDKIIRYIFKYQKVPDRWSLTYLFFDPDDEITLSYKEVYRLIHLIFESGLNELKSIYPEDFN